MGGCVCMFVCVCMKVCTSVGVEVKNEKKQ